MEPIAVIGVANLFPGSQNPQEFWQNLLDKKDTRSKLTSEDAGVDISGYMGKQGEVDKFYCEHGGFIRGFDFDSKGIDLKESRLAGLDDLYKWSLYAAREALSDAGVIDNPELLKRCGVVLANLSFPTRSSNYLFMPIYKGIFENALHKLALPEYLKLPEFSSLKLGVCDDNMLIAGYPATVIAQTFKLGGVNFALDAACASSCYSMKLACDYLNTGKADLMLAGAVSAADPLFLNMGFSIFHAYPDNGQSAPLDCNSKGLFAGEGAGFFVLKRYADALRDGDKIQSIIKGVGLSNDGKGEFVLSPNSKGQVLCYERAYDDAQVDPATIQIVECHATGTPKGDRVELASMGEFFSRYDTKPLIGSVKSNLSHLLSAAGMPGMMKVMRGMNEGVLPPTINMQEAVQAKDNYFGAEQIPTETIKWPQPHAGDPRRAGVSTFGFGGSNAHIVFEQPTDQPLEVNQSSLLEGNSSLPLAIISMAAHFGECEDLQQMQQLIIDGGHSFGDLPDMRWRGIERETQILKDQGLSIGKAPQGSYIESFDVDFMHFKIPPRKTDALIPQQMLLLQVADEAIHQAQIKEGANVAVIVAMGIELEMHRHRGRVNLEVQIKAALEEQGIELTEEEQSELISLSKSAMYDAASMNQYTSFIGNLMAARVAAVWDFSGPAFTVSAEENSVFQCLDIAENLFKTTNVEAVVIGAVDLAGGAEHVILRNRLAKVSRDPLSDDGWFVGEGAGAVVVKPADRVQDQSQIIARLDAYKMVSGSDSQALTQVMGECLEAANCSADDIAYVEAHASGVKDQDSAEQQAITQVYPHVAHIGSVKNNLGHCFAASGMASLIKVACCLSAKTIPQNPQTKNQLTHNKITSNHPWPQNKRAAINSLGADGRVAHVLMSPMGEIQVVPRVEPKRQLIRPIFLGDEAIQDKMLTQKALDKFLPLKQRLSAHNNRQQQNNNNQQGNEMTLSNNSAAASNAELALGSFVALETLNTKFKAWSNSNANSTSVDQPDAQQNNQAPAQSGQSSSSGFSLEPLIMKEDYTIPEKIIWDQDALIEFGEGDIANVFGPEFAIIDTYSRRVRLPTSDYLLVSRVTELDATPNVYEPSMMTTEYDIPLDAPYLMDGQIAWSVAVESGQCDLLLISYMGIDFKNKGNRVYRLLDCTLTFLEDIAFGGQTLRYEIYIDSFASQGDTLLFFFHYDCFVKDKKVLEMRGGCAGFFSDEELAGGKGVVRKASEIEARAKIQKQSFEPFLRSQKEEFSREDLVQLVHGNIPACFGSNYNQNGLNPSLRFASEKFLMIDHVTSVDPTGGPWGLGLVESYKILEPDHWYFPCHFKDDQVMAGSLMSDGCGQLVMFYMLYLGMQTQVKNARFQPLLGQKQKVRCRVQIRPQYNRLRYRMEVKEIGLLPEPYLKANVEIIIDDKVVVDFESMSVVMKEQDPNHPYTRKIPQLNDTQNNAQANNESSAQNNSSNDIGSQLQAAESNSATDQAQAKKYFGNNLDAPLMRIETDEEAQPTLGVKPVKHFEAPYVEGQNRVPGEFPISPYHFFEFATGDLKKCFGEELQGYSENRILPRMPCGDLQMVTRVLSVEGERSNFKKPAICHAQYVVPADAWYFKNSAHPGVVPYSILMEVALQPTGFISGWMRTITLAKKQDDLFYRNLHGSGQLVKHVDLRGKTIDNKLTLLSTTAMGGYLLQSYDFELSTDGQVFYKGSAVFAYLTAEVLSQQTGLDKGQFVQPWHVAQQKSVERIDLLDKSAPIYQQRGNKPFYRLAAGQLDFLNHVDIVEGGGDYRKGYVYAEKTIAPSDWFFQFHFHKDPVMPGSLAIEAVIQALQAYMLKNDMGANIVNPRFTQPLTKIDWKYGGQVTPLNKTLSLNIHIKSIQAVAGQVTVIGVANVYKDGLRIYSVDNIAVSLEESN